MIRVFIQTLGFSRRVAGRMDDDQLRRLESDIQKGGGAVMPGTGGFRKIRCPGRGRGKSGGWRVIFADYPQFGVTVLVAAYEKSWKLDVTPAERNALRQIRVIVDREMELTYGQEDIL